MLPRNDANDLKGLNLAHFVMPIINNQKVVKCLVSRCLKTKSMSEIGISKYKMLRNTKLEILKKQYKKRIQPKSDPLTEVIGCSSEYDIDLIA